MSGVLATGFVGKLPAHGDFLRRGLPEDVADRLDAWAASAMAALERHGAAPEYDRAPPAGWADQRLDAGAPRWVGLAIASVDRPGRRFPLVLAGALRPDAPAVEAASFLAHAVEAGRSAIVEGWSADALREALSSQSSAVDASAPLSSVWADAPAGVWVFGLADFVVTPTSGVGAQSGEALASAWRAGVAAMDAAQTDAEAAS